MALPKLDVPTYDVELPLSKKKIKYRPFLVKEQRNLLMAMESNDSDSIQNAIKQILHNCTLTEGIEIDNLPIIDVEYYFIQLRAKSVGEMVESKYRCTNIIEDDKVCNNTMEASWNLNNIKPTVPEGLNPEIQITDKITIKLKYPEFGFVKDSMEMDDLAEATLSLVAKSIEYIYDGDQFYYAHETDPQEMQEFVDNLNQDQFNKIEEFFSNLPKLKEKLEITCSKCGFHHELEVEGLENFFG
jgi:hypothetical protein